MALFTSLWLPATISFVQPTPLPQALSIGAKTNDCRCLWGDPPSLMPSPIGRVFSWSYYERRMTLWVELDNLICGMGDWGVSALYTTTNGVSLTYSSVTDHKGRTEDELTERARPMLLSAVGLVRLHESTNPETSPCAIRWRHEAYAAR